MRVKRMVRLEPLCVRHDLNFNFVDQVGMGCLQILQVSKEEMKILRPRVCVIQLVDSRGDPHLELEDGLCKT